MGARPRRWIAGRVYVQTAPFSTLNKDKHPILRIQNAKSTTRRIVLSPKSLQLAYTNTITIPLTKCAVDNRAKMEKNATRSLIMQMCTWIRMEKQHTNANRHKIERIRRVKGQRILK
jgi:hypothetical protein